MKNNFFERHQDRTRLPEVQRDEAWKVAGRLEKIRLARFYFELLNLSQRDEVWSLATDEEKFVIVSREPYEDWHMAQFSEDDQRDGFQRENHLIYDYEFGLRSDGSHSLYFRLLASDSQRNEVWRLMPTCPASENIWPNHFYNHGEHDLPEEYTLKYNYFWHLVLDFHNRAIKHRDLGDEMWTILSDENKIRVFDNFPSLVEEDALVEAWNLFSHLEKVNFLRRKPNSWSMSLLLVSDVLNDKERNDVWLLLDADSKVELLQTHPYRLKQGQIKEAWGLADEQAKANAVIEDMATCTLLSPHQAKEVFHVFSKKNKRLVREHYGFN